MRSVFLIATIALAMSCGSGSDVEPQVDAGEVEDSDVGFADAAGEDAADVDMGSSGPVAVEPSGTCHQTLARGAIRNEYFPRFTAEPFDRIVYRDDFFDPDTQENEFTKWQRVRGKIRLIGAQDVDSNVPGTLYATTSTYARTSPDEPLTFQRFQRTAEGFGPYISQFSVLINGRPVEATYRKMSIDGEILEERLARGSQQIVDEPYVADEVTFEPSQIPAYEAVDIALLSWIRPYDDSKKKTFRTWTSRFTLYNGGNAWPDETVTFLCPPEEPGEKTEYEEAFEEGAYPGYPHQLYLPGRHYDDHEDVIDVDSDEVDLWHLAQTSVEYAGYNYVLQLFVNGEPQGEPLFYSDPEDWVGRFSLMMRRPLTVKLDPDREVNVVHVSAFINPLEPIFTVQGKVYNRLHSTLGMSNILYLRNTNRTAE